MEMVEEKLPTPIENSIPTALANWLRGWKCDCLSKRSQWKKAAASSMNFLSNLSASIIKSIVFFHIAFLFFHIPFHGRTHLHFLKTKKIPTEGYSWQNLLLLVALSAQPKRWPIKSERTCCIQESVLWHLLWKVAFSYNFCTDYAWKKIRVLFLPIARYEVLVSQHTTEVSCQWSLKLKFPFAITEESSFTNTDYKKYHLNFPKTVPDVWYLDYGAGKVSVVT